METMKWGDGMAGCPAAGPSLQSQGQTKMPVRGCSSPYRAKSQGDLWQTSCHSPLPSEGTAAIMHRTGWQCIPKQTRCCPKYFQWLHLPWLNWSEDMRKHEACGASRPLKESYQTKLRQCITRDLRRQKLVFRSSTDAGFKPMFGCNSFQCDNWWKWDCSLLAVQEQGHASCIHLQEQRSWCSKLQASLAPSSSRFFL